MICTNVYLDEEVKQLLIKAAAAKGMSVESLASEIINEAIRDQLSMIKDEAIPKTKNKPALSGMKPFCYLGTPEESGIPIDEWDMENDYS